MPVFFNPGWNGRGEILLRGRLDLFGINKLT
jgi:hypothetical protein